MRHVGRLLSVCCLVLSTAATSIPAQRIHTVVDGQTLGAIARRYGITVEELREANQLPGGSRLKIGQRLLVPSPGEVARSKRGSSSAKGGASDAERSVTEPASSANAPERAVEEEVESTNAEPPASAPAPDAPTEPAQDGATPPDAPAAPPPVNPGTSDSNHEGNRAAPTKTERAERSRETPQSSTRKPKASERRTHTVADGQTLGKIAKRYRIKIESLCGANGIRRNEKLKLGQELVIPNGDEDPIIELGPPPSDDDDSPSRRNNSNPNSMKELDVPGAGPVYYYEPTGAGRMSMRPIVVYLHGRGGDAQADCRRWSRVARRFGWLLCPSGPTPHNAGRSWNNNWVSGQHAVMGSIQALRNLYGRRVQLYGNTLVGFSEGAYVAMNVGVRQPRTFNRWLILGADVSYWGGSGLEALKDAKSKVRRVVLITGGMDMVVDDTRTVAGWLEKQGVPLRIQTPGALAHEVALERMPGMYESALRWLDRGVESSSSQVRKQ